MSIGDEERFNAPRHFESKNFQTASFPEKETLEVEPQIIKVE
jgi:hypothetical protein